MSRCPPVHVLAFLILAALVQTAAQAQEPGQVESRLLKGEPAARIEAARQLAMDRKPATAPALKEALKDAEPMVRRFAVYALERIGDPAAVKDIAPLLKDQDAWVRRTAATALGKLGAKEGVPALLEALKDGDVYVRYDAYIALSRIGDPASQKPILEALNKDDRVWKDLATWEQQVLVEILEQPWFTDQSVKPLLLKLLDSANQPHPELDSLEPSRRASQLTVVSEAAAVVLAMKWGDASGEQYIVKGLAGGDYNEQVMSRAAARIKSKKAVPNLLKILDKAWQKVETWNNNQRYAIEALGDIGDKDAVAALEKFLKHEDFRLRTCAAAALARIDGQKRDIDPDGPAAVIPTIEAKDLGTPGGKRPPQFIVLGVDDCANVEGVESLLDICETLKANGSRAVFTMWLAPLAGSSVHNDLEKRKVVYQRLFDMGCEIAHHTLHHNPGGHNWSSLPREGQIEEIEGATAWYRENIKGFTRPFTHKGGGGGQGAAVDPQFTQQLMARQNFIYWAGRGGHPNDEGWPLTSTRRPGSWSVPTGELDANAPPVHARITDPIVSDYPGRFDYDLPQGVAMWKANFEYRYNHPRRPIIAVNAFHDWGVRDVKDKLVRMSHRNEGKILKEFLLDVLVKNKGKYPDTYCVTFSQVLEYATNGGDLKRTLEAGNGQDSRNPVKPSFEH